MNRALLNLLAVVTLIGYFVFPYQFINHHEWPRKPITLPLFPKEQQIIPFLPWTIIFYLSAYVQPVFTYLMSMKSSAVVPHLKSVVATMSTCYLVFMIQPTTSVQFRPAFETIAAPFGRLFEGLHTMDTPINCFPSMHCVTCYFQYRIVYAANKRAGFVFFIWYLLIASSTLTTRQHYALDCIASYLLCRFWLYVFPPAVKGVKAKDE